MSDIEICSGRGNTKKLAKNDAARKLVSLLQARGGAGCQTPDLARELAAVYKQRQASDYLNGLQGTERFSEGSRFGE